MMILTLFLTSSVVYAGPVSGTTFANIESEIISTSNGGTVDLYAITYSGSGSSINVNNKNNLVIQGPSSSNKATLDANDLSRIFFINSTSSKIIFRNINFINGNSGVSSGGAIRANPQVIIEDCTFSNMKGQSGTAIMLGEDATDSIIRNCEFRNCQSIYESVEWGWGEGAAIDSHADNTLIENCLFENNYAFKDGGAISLALGTGNIIKNCVFNNNYVESDDGGAIFIRNSEATIYDCVFNENYAESGIGGAISITDSIITIYDCVFNENYAESGIGGAISIIDSTATIYDCEFKNNSAIYGSAIYNDPNSVLIINNCLFLDNLAQTLDIIAPDYAVNRSDNLIIEISLLVGDNVIDAIYNEGTLTIDGLTPDELDSSPNQTINLIINNITYTEITDNSGVATFIIPTTGWNLGEYNYTVEYQTTTLYTSSNNTATVSD